MSKDDGDERIVELLLAARKPVSKETLIGFVKAVKEADGEFVSAAQEFFRQSFAPPVSKAETRRFQT